MAGKHDQFRRNEKKQNKTDDKNSLQHIPFYGLIKLQINCLHQE
jgi:hypothetical protein